MAPALSKPVPPKAISVPAYRRYALRSDDKALEDDLFGPSSASSTSSTSSSSQSRGIFDGSESEPEPEEEAASSIPQALEQPLFDPGTHDANEYCNQWYAYHLNPDSLSSQELRMACYELKTLSKVVANHVTSLQHEVDDLRDTNQRLERKIKSMETAHKAKVTKLQNDYDARTVRWTNQFKEMVHTFTRSEFHTASRIEYLSKSVDRSLDAFDMAYQMMRRAEELENAPAPHEEDFDEDRVVIDEDD